MTLHQVLTFWLWGSAAMFWLLVFLLVVFRVCSWWMGEDDRDGELVWSDEAYPLPKGAWDRSAEALQRLHEGEFDRYQGHDPWSRA